MKYRLRFFVILFLVALMSMNSCSWIYYVPNSQNVPLISEEKELAANFNMDVTEKAVGFEAQWAYAFIDHFAVQGNLFGWLGHEGSSGSIVEIAPGFATRMGENVVFETYAGYGLGRTFPSPLEEIYPNARINDYTIKFDRYFLQPAIGLIHNNVEMAFSTRLSACDYFGDKPIISVVDDNTFVKVERMNEFYTVEPALTLRLGWRHFKFHFQYVMVFPLVEKHVYLPFYDRYNFNFGFHFTTGGRFNKKMETINGMN